MLDDYDQPGPGPDQVKFTRLNLGSEPDARTPEAPQDDDALRQQRKIIAYMHSGDPRILEEHDVHVTANERHDVIWGLAQGNISADHIRGLLAHIPTPADSDQATRRTGNREIGVRHVFDRLAPDDQLRAILADFSREDPNQRNSVTPADVEAFLTHKPDPSALEPEIEQFLAQIELDNDAVKRAIYEAKMRVFLQTVYGKRYDYWEQFKLLQREALGGPGRAPERLSNAERQDRITQSLRAARSRLEGARVPGQGGNRVREALINGLRYAWDLDRPAVEVLQTDTLNLGVPEQRQAINALLHSLGAMIQPHDSTSSHMERPSGVTAQMLPNIAGDLAQLPPELAGDRASGSFAVTADRTVSPNGIKEVHFDSGIPGVGIVATGDAIDGRAPESYGGVQLTLKINMHQPPTAR